MFVKPFQKIIKGVLAVGAALTLVMATPGIASADSAPNTLFQLPSDSKCTKGFGGCVIYVKSAQLNSGRIIAGFEQATVVNYPAPDTAGGVKGETIPVYKSDNSGASWQKLSEVPPPSTFGDPAMAKYSSNWTTPYFYVLPQAVGNLAAGTLLVASVVSGEDEYYREQKANDSNWTPSADGDRRDMAIALYSSANEGQSWNFLNIIATGGWQGGSSSAQGLASNANVYRQQDPIWEPYLTVINGQLVTYYADENDYTGYDPNTGIPTLAPDNNTGPDNKAQILVHKTWNGTGASSWSQPVVDVPGGTFTFNGGTRIGGARPGMPQVVPTNDGKWLMAFESFSKGLHVRYKVSTDPLRFFAVGGTEGTDTNELPVTPGSNVVPGNGSPVLVRLSDGRIMYNSGGSGNVWINDGTSTGAWTERQTAVPAGYSRALQPLAGSNRVLILGNDGPSTLRYGDVVLDAANNKPVERIISRNSGLALDTNGASLADGANVLQWTYKSAANQQWQVQDAGSGYVRIVNRNSSRCLDVFQSSTADGARVVQWACNTGANQQWQVQDAGGGFFRLVNRNSGKCLDVDNFSTVEGGKVQQWSCTGNSNQQWSRAAA